MTKYITEKIRKSRRNLAFFSVAKMEGSDALFASLGRVFSPVFLGGIDQGFVFGFSEALHSGPGDLFEDGVDVRQLLFVFRRWRCASQIRAARGKRFQGQEKRVFQQEDEHAERKDHHRGVKTRALRDNAGIKCRCCQQTDDGSAKMGIVTDVVSRPFDSIEGKQKIGDGVDPGRYGKGQGKHINAAAWKQENVGIDYAGNSAGGAVGSVNVVPMQEKRKQTAADYAGKVDCEQWRDSEPQLDVPPKGIKTIHVENEMPPIGMQKSGGHQPITLFVPQNVFGAEYEAFHERLVAEADK